MVHIPATILVTTLVGFPFIFCESNNLLQHILMAIV